MISKHGLYSPWPSESSVLSAHFSHGDPLVVAAAEVLSWVYTETGETVALIVPDERW